MNQAFSKLSLFLFLSFYFSASAFASSSEEFVPETKEIFLERLKTADTLVLGVQQDHKKDVLRWKEFERQTGKKILGYSHMDKLWKEYTGYGLPDWENPEWSHIFSEILDEFRGNHAFKTILFDRGTIHHFLRDNKESYKPLVSFMEDGSELLVGPRTVSVRSVECDQIVPCRFPEESGAIDAMGARSQEEFIHKTLQEMSYLRIRDPWTFKRRILIDIPFESREANKLLLRGLDLSPYFKKDLDPVIFEPLSDGEEAFSYWFYRFHSDGSQEKTPEQEIRLRNLYLAEDLTRDFKLRVGNLKYLGFELPLLLGEREPPEASFDKIFVYDEAQLIFSIEEFEEAADFLEGIPQDSYEVKVEQLSQFRVNPATGRSSIPNVQGDWLIKVTLLAQEGPEELHAKKEIFFKFTID